MQTVTIHLGILITLIGLILLHIIILVFGFIRYYCVKSPEIESDEASLRPLPEVANQPKTSEITTINSASDGVLSQAPSQQCNAPPQASSKSREAPVIALSAATLESARLWMAKRGIGEGINVDSWAGEYELMLDPQPNDRVRGGILLPCLSKQDRTEWEESGKPVMVEGMDPIVETKGWAPSLTYPFKALLARVTDEIKVHETEVV